jgi:hypothetical protein
MSMLMFFSDSLDELDSLSSSEDEEESKKKK